MGKSKKVPVKGEVKAEAPAREPVVEPTHEEIVAGVPDLGFGKVESAASTEGFKVVEFVPVETKDGPSFDVKATLTVTVSKQEFAALMYAMVTGMVNGWVRQAAVTRLGTMLGGKTHQERMELWEDMKQTHLNKPGNQ